MAQYDDTTEEQYDRAMAWFLMGNMDVLHAPIDVSSSGVLIYLCMAGYAGKDRKDIRPSVPTLMKMSRLSKHTVIKAIRELCDLGLLVLVEEDRAEERKGSVPSLYRLRDTDKHLESCRDDKGNWVGWKPVEKKPRHRTRPAKKQEGGAVSALGGSAVSAPPGVC